MPRRFMQTVDTARLPMMHLQSAIARSLSLVSTTRRMKSDAGGICTLQRRGEEQWRLHRAVGDIEAQGADRARTRRHVQCHRVHGRPRLRAARAHEQLGVVGAALRRGLPDREVDERLELLPERPVLRVARDADDLIQGSIAPAQALAERVALRPEVPRRGLIDHGRAGAVLLIVAGQGAPGEQRNAERLEIILVGVTEPEDRARSSRTERQILDDMAGRLGAAGERQGRGHSHRADAREARQAFGDAVEQAGRLTRFTSPFNLTGLPALSLPCGMTKERLPIGLQIVSRAWADAKVLNLGHLFEQSTDWHQRFPPDV